MPNMLPGAAPTAAGMQMSQLPLLQAQAQMSPTAAAAAAAQYQSLADYAAYGATAAYPGNLFHLSLSILFSKMAHFAMQGSMIEPVRVNFNIT